MHLLETHDKSLIYHLVAPAAIAWVFSFVPELGGL